MEEDEKKALIRILCPYYGQSVKADWYLKYCDYCPIRKECLDKFLQKLSREIAKEVERRRNLKR